LTHRSMITWLMLRSNEWAAVHPRRSRKCHRRQTCGALCAPGLFMTRWCAATAPQSSAASVEPRWSPLTNSLSAKAFLLLV